MTPKATFQFSKSGLYFIVFRSCGNGSSWMGIENTCSSTVGAILFTFLDFKH